MENDKLMAINDTNAMDAPEVPASATDGGSAAAAASAEGAPAAGKPTRPRGGKDMETLKRVLGHQSSGPEEDEDSGEAKKKKKIKLEEEPKKEDEPPATDGDDDAELEFLGEVIHGPSGGGGGDSKKAPKKGDKKKPSTKKTAAAAGKKTVPKQVRPKAGRRWPAKKAQGEPKPSTSAAAAKKAKKMKKKAAKKVADGCKPPPRSSSSSSPSTGSSSSSSSNSDSSEGDDDDDDGLESDGSEPTSESSDVSGSIDLGDSEADYKANKAAYRQKKEADASSKPGSSGGGSGGGNPKSAKAGISAASGAASHPGEVLFYPQCERCVGFSMRLQRKERLIRVSEDKKRAYLQLAQCPGCLFANGEAVKKQKRHQASTRSPRRIHLREEHKKMAYRRCGVLIARCRDCSREKPVAQPVLEHRGEEYGVIEVPLCLSDLEYNSTAQGQYYKQFGTKFGGGGAKKTGRKYK